MSEQFYIADIESFSLKKDEKISLEENKISAKFWYNKGVDFSESKEYEKALQVNNKALSFDSNDPDIWNNKCSILNKLARYDEAVVAGNKAMQLSPQDPVIIENLRDAYMGCNNREKADECQKNLLKIARPIKSVPNLTTINGFGTKIYGDTVYYVALYIPIWPIARYVVEEVDYSSYRFLFELDFHPWQQFWRNSILAIVLLWVGLTIIVYLLEYFHII